MFTVVAITGSGYKAFNKHETIEEALIAWNDKRLVFPSTAVIIRDGITCHRYTMGEIEKLRA